MADPMTADPSKAAEVRPDWQARFERLRDAIRVFSYRESVAALQFLRLKDDSSFKEHVMDHAAQALGRALLRDGLLEIKEWDEDDDNPIRARHIIQIRAETLLPPGTTGTFASQLDDAERAGYARAITEIREHAAKLDRMEFYGPVQALAMRGLADDLQRRAPNLKGTHTNG